MRLQLRDPHLHPFTDYDIGRLIEDRAAARGKHPFLVWEPFEGERRVWLSLIHI